jgi:hypothetical protein
MTDDTPHLAQQQDLEARVDELAAWLCALEDAECHKPIPESLIEHGRRYIYAGVTEEHCGDCTKQSHSCVVCGTDGYRLHARQILAALAPGNGAVEVYTQQEMDEADKEADEIHKALFAPSPATKGRG